MCACACVFVRVMPFLDTQCRNGEQLFHCLMLAFCLFDDNNNKAHHACWLLLLNIMAFTVVAVNFCACDLVGIFFFFTFLLFLFLVFTAWHDKSGAKYRTELFTRQDFKTICVHEFHILVGFCCWNFVCDMPNAYAHWRCHCEFFPVCIPFFEPFHETYSVNHITNITNNT